MRLQNLLYEIQEVLFQHREDRPDLDYASFCEFDYGKYFVTVHACPQDNEVHVYNDNDEELENVSDYLTKHCPSWYEINPLTDDDFRDYADDYRFEAMRSA